MNWIDSLHRMRSLEKGWNGHSADPPSEDALAVAAAVLSELEGIAGPPDNLDATLHGCLGITYWSRDRRRIVRVCIQDDGTILASNHDARPRWVEPDLDGVRRLGREILDFLADAEARS